MATPSSRRSRASAKPDPKTSDPKTSDPRPTAPTPMVYDDEAPPEEEASAISTRVVLDRLAARAGHPDSPRARMWNRVLPRGVLGISALILAFAIGAGFSGVVLFSYYQYKLNDTNRAVNNLISKYKGQFAKAEADLAASAAAAKADIAQQLKAVQQLQGSPTLLATLTKEMSPSVYFVHTTDNAGQPSVGTAFVISSNSNQSLLITSYTTVAAATHSPAPNVYLSHGASGSDVRVSVRTWDSSYDLALLVLPQGNLPALTAAPTSPSPQPGDRLYSISGLGSANASIDEATVVDVSASGIAVDAAGGQAFQGGPLVNQQGQVVAVASRTYSPVNFASTGILYSPYVEAACSKILSCPGGTLVGSH